MVVSLVFAWMEMHAALVQPKWQGEGHQSKMRSQSVFISKRKPLVEAWVGDAYVQLEWLD
jgi:hypothetical protein